MHGCFPSHFIFFLLHSSHARVTRLRFCRGTGARGAGADDVGEFGPCDNGQEGEATGCGSSSASNDSGEEGAGVVDEASAPEPWLKTALDIASSSK